MSRRATLSIGIFLVVWGGFACLDVSSPVTGIASITTVLAPIPSVAVGDSSRDTLGALDSLRVYAFAPNGDTVRDARVVFFALDTTHKLSIDSLTGIARGDALSPNAAVSARVTPANGKGSLQTPVVPYPVVPVPVSATKDSDITLFSYNATVQDTISSELLSPPLSVTVNGAGGAVVQRYLVSFEIIRSPHSRNHNGEPTVVLSDDTSKPTSVDTTDASGHGSRRLRIRRGALDDNVNLGAATDTAVVRVHVWYRGSRLITPADSFIVPIRGR
jgi:hypothetical protein